MLIPTSVNILLPLFCPIQLLCTVYTGNLNSQKHFGFGQVSVLTDQVEAQGEKIRDLDLCLDEHREKLNSTEEMLQQVCVCVCLFFIFIFLFKVFSPRFS